jgi:hypothetical protein
MAKNKCGVPTTLYKLTDQKNKTYNGAMRWEIGKTNEVKKCKNPCLCSEDVIHAYKDKNLALLLNAIHADIENPRIFECEGKVAVEDWDKVGVFSLTIKKELRYPRWWKQKNDVFIAFAVLCAESVLNIFETKYPNDKRPRKAIEAAKKYLKTKTPAAAHAAYAARAAADAAAAAAAAAYAAHAAADAYAAHAARPADAAAAAAHAAHAAHAAAHAAHAAARAAAGSKIDFAKLAKQAIKMIKEVGDDEGK